MIKRVALAIALCSSGCTFLLPTTSVVVASRNADVDVDEHGCERHTDTPTCVHPGPVKYGRTILDNALVGIAVDVFILAAIMATTNDAG